MKTTDIEDVKVGRDKAGNDFKVCLAYSDIAKRFKFFTVKNGEDILYVGDSRHQAIEAFHKAGAK